ncbi:PREDICTED: acetyl-coenzyme A synthetase isoform X1 [Wasmannia auropunctata]|uniref:acetyl-coenzyme A synthetase isoform X1 n=2 Tax=Wasmannia auropunctata TaxID=64793 RepID=UPI0005EF7530|nr:PREDICTED: acetyl-coenzyme A synthetase isoform X1 [Wasmannia auropunctata]XP_011687990.1 PREDICTED: acetyl-coenzyme A synthetase isoform X1 [Wasmannia auropunctata]XP_011687991.1 PREDICTED: acetyl-coenzyme A synthetase isoform X1 [Wasmannia auropunctata]XP_011687993.1 PREDICTED: acetyl-coenzyme A synthetase isoform X1 [Wasmannia auropunctata]
MAEKIYYPNPEFAREAHCASMEQYKRMHEKSIKEPEQFWGEIAKQFYWETPTTDDKFFSYNFDLSKGDIFIKWMEGASTNISFNLLDKNVKSGNGDKIAFYWEGNDPEDYSRLTYRKLLEETCRFANVLKSKGVSVGDKVVIYMPMVLELPIAMLACTRIGAVHSVVFAGYSSDSLAERILDSKAKVLITADGVWRGEKLLLLKNICDEAADKVKKHDHQLESCIVVAHLRRLNNPQGKKGVNGTSNGTVVDMANISWDDDRDVWWHDEMEDAEASCYPVWMAAEDPLFILYTSGSTGKPKGVLHTTAGYLIYAATTFKYVFDYHPGDVYWCTADCGWITGHTYVVYGPLANGATSVIFEGTPFYPENDRYWSIIDKYKVTQFYTAPTAIRSLMKFGDELVKRHSLSTLKVLGSVGEPINTEAWLWFYNLVGHGKCSIADTFWQTETGGHVITPLPGATPMKPGSATFPFFGVLPELLDEDGRVIEGEGEGYLVFRRPWPGMMRTLYGNHQRFQNTYFDRFNGFYCTGDGARRDADGYLWVTGRIDDMLNVSGHLMSTAEVESVLAEHSSVTEAAVVSKSHPVKGQCLYCFITPTVGMAFDEKLQVELKKKVRERIGPFAQPDVIQHAPALPKTRSGKIMRRMLRKIAAGDRNIGDTSTLADETVIQLLFELRPCV